ncbi:hypothetical protein SK128_000352 [Halocaridina rubra]|uniref:Uncharacterized protein n=1 Tax=Halocaridina rubra TaxID=373956 RepID=A0AAN9AHR5_HALRR
MVIGKEEEGVTSIQMGDKVLVKPLEGKCTSHWRRGNVMDVHSQNDISVNGMPHHILDLRWAVDTKESVVEEDNEEPLENDSPVRYSPGPAELPPSTGSRPLNSLTPTDPVPSIIGVKDLPFMDSDTQWRSLKREREGILKWNPKFQKDESLFLNLDFMRGHESLARRVEPPLPMEGVNFHDSANGIEFINNHDSPFKSLVSMRESRNRIPQTPLKKTRTDENLHYSPIYWGSGTLEPSVGFVPEELQQQCYRRVLMNTATQEMRMRTPPVLIPLPQPQPPLRPRPLAPLRTHAFPTSMEWDHVNLHYLAYFLQNRGGPYCDTIPAAGPFSLPREHSFFNSSVS